MTEFAIEPYAADAPLHIVAMRTPEGQVRDLLQLARQGIEPLAAGREAELYDYATHGGRLELDNSAGESPLEDALREAARTGDS